MARITVEDCLDNESNRFALVRLAARRAKQLLSGSTPVTDTKGNRAIVSALREIADGKVKFSEGKEEPQQHAVSDSAAAGYLRSEPKPADGGSSGITQPGNSLGGSAVGGSSVSSSENSDDAHNAAPNLS